MHYILGLHVYIINILFWHRNGVPCSHFAYKPCDTTLNPLNSPY